MNSWLFAHAEKKDHEKARTLNGWYDLPDEIKVAVIIDGYDETMIDGFGGYPTDYAIKDGVVYWASLDAGKEYRRTELIIMPIDDFIGEHEGSIIDDLD